MACFSQFTCKHCGFEILTEPRFYYRLMSGYYVTRKCSKCKSIIEEHFQYTDIPVFRDPEDFFKWIESNDFHSKYDFCPKCHHKSRLTLWSPTTCRCPKCRHMLTMTQKNIMMAD